MRNLAIGRSLLNARRADTNARALRPRQAGRVRLFVAVWPSEEVLERIAALPRPEVRGLRWTTPDQWHVTLRFFGEADEDEVVAVFRGIDVESTGDTVAHLGPATGRFGQRVLHVPVEGLEALARATLRATKGVGNAPDC